MHQDYSEHAVDKLMSLADIGFFLIPLQLLCVFAYVYFSNIGFRAKHFHTTVFCLVGIGATIGISAAVTTIINAFRSLELTGWYNERPVDPAYLERW